MCCGFRRFGRVVCVVCCYVGAKLVFRSPLAQAALLEVVKPPGTPQKGWESVAKGLALLGTLHVGSGPLWDSLEA